MAHVLFATINKIRQKITGDVNEERDDPNTKPCHSHLKHSNGLETKSLVGVATDLGIPIEDACNKDSQRLFDTEENAKDCLHIRNI